MIWRGLSSRLWEQRNVVVFVIALWLSSEARAQIGMGGHQAPPDPTRTSQSAETGDRTQEHAEAALQQGTALTRRGAFAEAIPRLLAARGRVTNEYAADFNLALCYVGTSQFKEAIQILIALRGNAHETPDVNNLLAQAYVGNEQSQEAFDALQRASAEKPNNEKLYVFVADACTDHRNYALGLKVVDLGLRYVPESPRLHYQKGMFLSWLDRLDLAGIDFDLAAKFAPDSEIAFLASAQKNLLDGNIPAAIQAGRDGVNRGHEGYALLAVLGEALIRSGISAGEPEFEEAKAVLGKAVVARPDYAGSQIALGKLCLMEGHLDDAIAHLERARQLDPGNTSIYAHLTTAYRRHGEPQRAQDMLAALARLNQGQADKIGSVPGDRKASYGGLGIEHEVEEVPHHP